ncbi:selenocysteine-specific translation elongation factor, partial [Shewanella sp. C31]|nr:selenocysteine-specific translation elongation factor [Shewanella electrica]
MVSPKLYQQQQQLLLDTLASFHEQHPDQPGVGLHRLLRMAQSTLPDAVAVALVDDLTQQQRVLKRGSLLLLT